MNILDGVNLNDSQRAFVMHDDGPAAALAVAGSGKTQALTARVARLLERNIPESIVAVTFTKKAAEEMRTRVDRLVGDGRADDCQIRTFHSLCYHLLSKAGRGKPLLTGYRQERMMRDVMKDAGIDEEPYAVLGAISWIANSRFTTTALRRLADEGLSYHGVDADLLGKLARAYERAKVRAEVYDFDDLITKAIEVLERHGDIYRDRWRHIMVDEFQDTNTAQMDVLGLLCPPHSNPNLAVVGDDDQSIYSWRAAMPEYLIEFNTQYRGAAIFRMEDNYRCQATVVDHANELIHHNKVRVAKRMQATLPAGAAPTIFPSESERCQADYIVDRIRADIDNGGSPRHHAVLYRTNAMSQAVEDSMIKARLPYRILGGVGFYGRKEIRDLVAFARLIVDPNDNAAFRRVYNVPNRYLGKAALRCVDEAAEQIEGGSLFRASVTARYSKTYMADRFAAFRSIIDSARRGDYQVGLDNPARPGDILRWLTAKIGYREYLQEQGPDDADDSRWENVTALAASADGFENMGDFAFFARNASAKGKDDKHGDKVTLLTLHRAKGLEWPVIYIIGVNDGVLPHRRAENIEEERRLMYVGMTRAKRELHIGLTDTTFGKATSASRFIAEAGLSIPVPVTVGEQAHG